MQHYNNWSFDASNNSKSTETVVEKHRELFVASNKGKFGIVDPYFGWVVQPEYTEIQTSFRGSYWGMKADVWQLFNLRGETISDKQFVCVSKYSSDFALVSLDGQNFGFVDKAGRFVIPPIYNFGRYLGNNMFAVKLNEKYGVVDIYGRTILPFRFRSLDQIPLLK